MFDGRLGGYQQDIRIHYVVWRKGYAPEVSRIHERLMGRSAEDTALPLLDRGSDFIMLRPIAHSRVAVCSSNFSLRQAL